MKKMKRFFAGLGIVVCLFLLTACEAQFVEANTGFPWWTVVLADIVFILVLVVLAGKVIARHPYSCSLCGNAFRPGVFEAALALHLGDDRMFKCPACGIKNFCKKAPKIVPPAAPATPADTNDNTPGA